MAHTGKIGFHFPTRSNPNLDTYDIKFLPAGSTASSINDFQQVNKVYAIPAGVTITSVADLQNYVVWELINNILINDSTTNEYLMIKYKPTENVDVSSIGVFVDSSGNGNGSDRLIICQDDGLLIYTGYGQSQETTIVNYEKYSYTGLKRVRSLDTNVTLYAGKTYWIHYHFSDCRNHRGTIYQGQTGSYKNMSTFNMESFGAQTAVTSMSNVKFTNTIIKTDGSNTEKLDYFIRNASYNTRIDLYGGTHKYYRYLLDIDNTKYKGIIVCGGGNNDWWITDSSWNNLNLSVGDYFILQSQYYSGRWKLCECTSTSGTSSSIPYEDCYNVLFNGEGVDQVNGILEGIGQDKNIFITEFGSGSGATYWNTTYNDKKHYLEINGNEISSTNERL